jgi:polar amino acid transport system substrate-binding protein
MKKLAFILILTFPAIAKEKIVFGTINYCPFVCEGNKERPGLMIEIAKETFHNSPYDLKVSYMSLKRAVSEVKNNNVDGFILGSKVHFKSNHFPKTVTSPQPIYFFKSTEKNWKYTGIDSLKGKRIGAIENFNYMNKSINDFLKTSKDITWLGHSNAHKRAFELLNLGRINTFIGGSYSTQYLANVHNASKFISKASKPISFYDNYISLTNKLPVNKRDKILKLLDEKMKELKSSGKLQKIYNKYSISSKYL